MNGLQDDEAEKLRRDGLIRVGNSLRDYYGHVIREGVPDRLTESFAASCVTGEIGVKSQT